MVDLQLLGPHTPNAKAPESFSALMRNLTSPKTAGLTVLHHSRRPAMLTYTSPIPFLAQTLMYLPLHVLNVRDLDSACLRIPMFELLSFPRGSANLPTHVRLDIQSDSSANTGSTLPTFNIPFIGSTSSGVANEIKPKVLQVYSSKIHFSARFRGLRYVIYNYRVLSFLVFTTLFYVSSVVSMAMAWAAISAFLTKQQDDGVVVKRENGTIDKRDKGRGRASGEEKRIKEEEEDSTSGGLSASNLSDTPASFPTTSRQPPLQYPGRPSTSSSVASAAGQPLRLGEVADDEDGDEGARRAAMEQAWERGREGDSGIGTSMESEGAGLVRRRSGRASGSGSRD
jgi:cell wall-associated NlpC family hydrolase